MIKKILSQKKFEFLPIIETDKLWRILHFKTNDFEYFNKYDGHNNLVYYKQISWDHVIEKIWKYDMNKNLLYIKDGEYEERKKYKYINKQWKVVKQYNNEWIMRQYDYYKNWLLKWWLDQAQDWFVLETSFEYDKKWRVIKREQSDWYREKWEYINNKDEKWEIWSNSRWEKMSDIFNKKTKTKTVGNNWEISTTMYNKKGEIIGAVSSWYETYIDGEVKLEISITPEWNIYTLNGVVLEEII